MTNQFALASAPAEITVALDENNAIHVHGPEFISTAAGSRLLSILIRQRIADIEEGISPNNSRYTSVAELTSELQISEEALRRRALMLRTSFGEFAEQHWRRSISRDALIQSKHHHGYRLAPEIRLVSISQIRGD
jgi:biotin operon repressor